jgi:hypothetical protein
MDLMASRMAARSSVLASPSNIFIFWFPLLHVSRRGENYFVAAVGAWILGVKAKEITWVMG